MHTMYKQSNIDAFAAPAWERVSSEGPSLLCAVNCEDSE